MLTWDTKCLDWKQRLLSGSSLVPDLPLFDDQAARALRIFRRLRIPDVSDNPTFGEACGDWVFPIVGAIFGAYDAEARRRMIQEFFLLIPKKNAKSTIAAAIMVVALIMNSRPLAEFLLIAPTKEIADIAFRQASGIIKIDPELAKLFHLQRHIRTITHRRSEAVLVIKAADTDVITGSKSTGILIDETHVFAEKANAADVFVEIRGALAARPDGFMLQITTQSKKPPAGVFKSELQMARDVRDGKVTYPMLPVLYELPDNLAADGGWKRREFWPLINPNMGKSVDETFLVNQLVKAEREGMAALALLASQHFNVEIGLSLKTDRWRGADYWERHADRKLVDLSELMDRCEVCVAGVDGGGLDDMLGLCIGGREHDTQRWLLWHRTWIHRSVLDLRKSEAPRLLDFAGADELVIVGDMREAYRQVAERIAQVAESGLLPDRYAVGLDPMGVAMIVDALRVAGIEGEDRVMAVPQGWKLSGAIWTTEVKLASSEIVHSGQAILNYAVGNAKVEPKGNAITITKQTAGTAKIDPLMATFCAVACLSLNPGTQESVFDAMGRDDALSEIHARALQYVVNAGGAATVASFDEDHEPIGPSLRGDLMPRYMISAPGGRLHLTGAGRLALGGDEGAQSDDEDEPIDRAILQDMNHPLFAEMKRRFEAWQDRQPDEEF